MRSCGELGIISELSPSLVPRPLVAAAVSGASGPSALRPDSGGLNPTPFPGSELRNQQAAHAQRDRAAVHRMQLEDARRRTQFSSSRAIGGLQATDRVSNSTNKPSPALLARAFAALSPSGLTDANNSSTITNNNSLILDRMRNPNRMLLTGRLHNNPTTRTTNETSSHLRANPTVDTANSYRSSLEPRDTSLVQNHSSSTPNTPTSVPSTSLDASSMKEDLVKCDSSMKNNHNRINLDRPDHANPLANDPSPPRGNDPTATNGRVVQTQAPRSTEDQQEIDIDTVDQRSSHSYFNIREDVTHVPILEPTVTPLEARLPQQRTDPHCHPSLSLPRTRTDEANFDAQRSIEPPPHPSPSSSSGNGGFNRSADSTPDTPPVANYHVQMPVYSPEEVIHMIETVSADPKVKDELTAIIRRSAKLSEQRAALSLSITNICGFSSDTSISGIGDDSGYVVPEGISYDKSQNRYRTSYKEGKRLVQKVFSIRAHGEKKALTMAVEQRKQWIREGKVLIKGIRKESVKHDYPPRHPGPSPSYHPHNTPPLNHANDQHSPSHNNNDNNNNNNNNNSNNRLMAPSTNQVLRMTNNPSPIVQAENHILTATSNRNASAFHDVMRIQNRQSNDDQRLPDNDNSIDSVIMQTADNHQFIHPGMATEIHNPSDDIHRFSQGLTDGLLPDDDASLAMDDHGGFANTSFDANNVNSEVTSNNDMRYLLEGFGASDNQLQYLNDFDENVSTSHFSPF